MSNVIVTLGGVPFQDFEVPEKISIGGAQRIAVQTLIGGGRVVDVLGSEDAAISFGGIFSGTDATQRAQTLDAMRQAGAVIPLVWDAFYYNVVIAEFAADYRKSWWIPFYIRCVIASEPPVDGLDVPAAQLVANDLAVAATLFGQAGLVLTGLTPPTTAGLAAAQLQISAGISSSGAALDGSALSLNGARDASSGIAAVNQLSATSASLAGLTDMSGYVARATSNFVEQLL